MKNKITYLLFVLCISYSVTSQNKKASTATDNVSIIEHSLIIPSLNNFKHRLWVYLPPNYHNSNKSFPVIYMHDGQNLFDDATSFIGEWSVDETLNAIYNKTGKGFIVVGIENGGDYRVDEYTPWENEKYGGEKT